MSVWNILPIKGLMKLHALVPCSEPTLARKYHDRKPSVNRCPATGVQICLHGKVGKAVETLVTTVTSGDTGQQETRCCR